MKRVLVTGGSGFIGSALVHRLLAQKNTFVVNVDCLYPCATHTLCESIPGKYEFVKGDITEQGLILRLLLLHDIQLCMHVSAQSDVTSSYANPSLFIKDNVLGTQMVLDAVRECHQKSLHTKPRLLVVSTDEVYGESENDDDKKHEGSLLQPTNAYAATKAAAEMMVHAYRRSFKIPVVLCRGNNAVGPRQYPEKVVPRFITLLQRGLPLTIQGDGLQRRSFVYVEDFVSGLLYAAERGQDGHIYNIGNDREVTVLEVARTIAKTMGVKPNIIYVKDRDFNDKRYWIQSDALRSLGWKPTVSFEEAIQKTVAWYLNEMPVDYFVKPFALPLPVALTPPVPLFVEETTEQVRLHSTKEACEPIAALA